MFYRKNLYSWEQWLRILAGLGLAAYAALAMKPAVLSYALIASGVIFSATGIFGWCPACAMVGRRLKKPD